MMLWQLDLFDPGMDVFTSWGITEPRNNGNKKKRAKRTPKGIDALSSLLPWLFPEDFPEYRDIIDQTVFSWSDDDINALCKGLLHETMYGLLRPKTGNPVRDEAVEWLFNEAVTPFSFRHCCLALRVNPLRMRERVFAKMLQARRQLEKKRLEGTITIREGILNHWLGEQGWLYELEAAGETRSIEDDYGPRDPTAIWCHYEREASKFDAHTHR
jgi:hypothetical protein